MLFCVQWLFHSAFCFFLVCKIAYFHFSSRLSLSPSEALVDDGRIAGKGTEVAARVNVVFGFSFSPSCSVSLLLFSSNCCITRLSLGFCLQDSTPSLKLMERSIRSLGFIKVETAATVHEAIDKLPFLAEDELLAPLSDPFRSSAPSAAVDLHPATSPSRLSWLSPPSPFKQEVGMLAGLAEK